MSRKGARVQMRATGAAPFASREGKSAHQRVRKSLSLGRTLSTLDFGYPKRVNRVIATRIKACRLGRTLSPSDNRCMDAETAAQPSPRRRGPGRPFKPGQSGNPGGIKGDLLSIIEQARRMALRYAPKAIDTLAACLDHADARVRVSAAEGLLDRAGLRPYSLEPERVEVVASVDVDALRASLAARVAGIVLAREVTPEVPALPPAGRGQAPESE
jgi:hypothetical protein